MRSLFYAAPAGALALALATTPALAQDNGTTWTGGYLGVVAGGAWGNTKARARVSGGTGAEVIPPADADLLGTTQLNDKTHAGFTGGVEGGYNFQAGPWVFGVEGDWTSLDVKNTSQRILQSSALTSPPVVFSLNQKVRTDWMVSLRPRIGYASGPWMAYITTGLAWSKLKYSAAFSDTRSPADALTAAADTTKTGWAIGAGGAYRLGPRWSVKGEWLRADFGHIGSTQVGEFVTLTPRDSVKTNMFRLGADYHF